MSDSMEAICIHEAAHCVVAMALGFPAHDVHFTCDQGADGGWHIHGEVLPRIPYDPDRRIDFGKVTLAGLIADGCSDGSREIDLEGETPDHVAMRKLFESGEEVMEIAEEVADLLEERWPEVLFLAADFEVALTERLAEES